MGNYISSSRGPIFGRGDAASRDRALQDDLTLLLKDAKNCSADILFKFEGEPTNNFVQLDVWAHSALLATVEDFESSDPSFWGVRVAQDVDRPELNDEGRPCDIIYVDKARRSQVTGKIHSAYTPRAMRRLWEMVGGREDFIEAIFGTWSSGHLSVAWKGYQKKKLHRKDGVILLCVGDESMTDSVMPNLDKEFAEHTTREFRRILGQLGDMVDPGEHTQKDEIPLEQQSEAEEPCFEFGKVLYSCRVHKFVLKMRIPYFKVAMECNFRDSNSNIKCLSQEIISPFALAAVIKYAYTGSVHELFSYSTTTLEFLNSSSCEDYGDGPTPRTELITDVFDLARAADFFAMKDLMTISEKYIRALGHGFKCGGKHCLVQLPQIMVRVIDQCGNSKLMSEMARECPRFIASPEHRANFFSGASFYLLMGLPTTIISQLVTIMQETVVNDHPGLRRQSSIEALKLLVFVSQGRSRTTLLSLALSEKWESTFWGPLIQVAYDTIVKTMDQKEFFGNIRVLLQRSEGGNAPFRQIVADMFDAIIPGLLESSEHSLENIWTGTYMVRMEFREECKDVIKDAYERLCRWLGEKENWAPLAEKGAFRNWKKAERLKELSLKIRVGVDVLLDVPEALRKKHLAKGGVKEKRAEWEKSVGIIKVTPEREREPHTGFDWATIWDELPAHLRRRRA